MKSLYTVIEKNEKYERIWINNISVGDLFLLFTNPKYCMFFIVFNDRNSFYRYKLRKIKNFEEFCDILKKNSFTNVEIGINSEDVNILNAEFVDCYYTLNNGKKN